MIRSTLASRALLLGLCVASPGSAIAAGVVTNGTLPLDNLKGRYLNFEVGPVTPLAFSDDQSALYAINQSGARLEVLDPTTLARTSEVAIGLGAASAVPRPGTSEVWVVDRVAGCVSVVDLALGSIARTIPVGAEPHGLVFSDSGDRAYVTCSAVDRVDVIRTSDYQVVKEIAIPAKNPRGIAYSNGRAYVVAFLSGNNTAPRGIPGDTDAVETVEVVEGPGVTPLPDRDLFVIPSAATPDLDELDPDATVSGLGTILFNAHVRPGTNELWIPNTEALNAAHRGEVNFVEGQVVSNRITIVDTTGSAPVRIIDLDAISPPGIKCGQPTGIAFHRSMVPAAAAVQRPRERAFVCGFGSDTVAVLNLDPQGNVTWRGAIRIPPKQPYPQGVGPRTCVVDSAGRYLYVYNKRDNSVTKVDLSLVPTSANFVYTAPFPVKVGFNPMATRERHGRHFFESTDFSKSKTSSCASCHVDGHTDGIAWDLSHFLDPEGTPNAQLTFGTDIKGPLVTQSVRRMEETGPYHWRGEKFSIGDFNGAFINLLENEVNGQSINIEGNILYMEEFVNRMPYPANPRQQKDRLYTQAELDGADVFVNKPVLGALQCASCHVLPLGTAGDLVAETAAGVLRSGDVPHLRGVADKLTAAHPIGGDFGVRSELGAGLTHAGAFPTIQSVALQDAPGQPGVPKFNVTAAEADSIAAFLTAFDTGMSPAAAHQATATAANQATFVAQELAYLVSQAEAGNCDVIFYRTPALPGSPALDTGMYDVTTHKFQLASAGAAQIEAQDLMDEAANGLPVTFVGVPLGMGLPHGLDREMDGLYNLDEITLGTNPEFPHSDGDFFPDGYEVEWGMDPLATTAASPDTQAPSLVGPVRLIYATTNTLKLEFDTSEKCIIEVLVDGSPVQRIPVGNYRDDLHFLICNGLQPDRDYTISLEMTDNAGNQFTDSTTVLHTRPRVLPEPAHVESIDLMVTPSVGGGATLLSDVNMRVGTSLPANGYSLYADVYYLPSNLPGVVVKQDAHSTLSNGVASFRVVLPPPSNPGEVVFVVKKIEAPVGEVPYVLALNQVTSASVIY